MSVSLDVEMPGDFSIYVRVLRSLQENFSVGLRWSRGKEEGLLVRVNGLHGTHRNPDGGYLIDAPHVHAARGDANNRPPYTSKLPWAWPLAPEYLAISRAWGLLLTLGNITSTQKTDRAVASLHANQMALEFDSPEGSDE